MMNSVDVMICHDPFALIFIAILTRCQWELSAAHVTHPISEITGLSIKLMVILYLFFQWNAKNIFSSSEETARKFNNLKKSS